MPQAAEAEVAEVVATGRMAATPTGQVLPIPSRADTLPPAAVDATRAPTLVALALLFVAALPDAMLPPVLRGVFVERYGASVEAAHWFMAVNLLGALAALPALGVMRRRVSTTTLLVGASLVNAALLAALVLPIGAGWSLTVRAACGAADLAVFAVLFDLLAKGGSPRRRGRRMGVAGTVMMLGLGGGAALGGVIGAGQPMHVFTFGATCCMATALGAMLFRRSLRYMVRYCPAIEIDPAHGLVRRPLWPALAMVCSDRALAGLLAVTVPVLLASIAGWDSRWIGALTAVPLLLMALGAWPAGWLGDRIGHLRLRILAAITYAVAVTMIPLTALGPPGAMIGLMAGVGLAGACLMPTSLAIASRSGRGAVAMGAWHGGGNLGFFIGISGAGVLLGLLGGPEPSWGSYAAVIAAFAVIHAGLTVVSSLGLRRRVIDAPTPAALPVTLEFVR